MRSGEKVAVNSVSPTSGDSPLASPTQVAAYGCLVFRTNHKSTQVYEPAALTGDAVTKNPLGPLTTAAQPCRIRLRSPHGSASKIRAGALPQRDEGSQADVKSHVESYLTPGRMVARDMLAGST